MQNLENPDETDNCDNQTGLEGCGDRDGHNIGDNRENLKKQDILAIPRRCSYCSKEGRQ